MWSRTPTSPQNFETLSSSLRPRDQSSQALQMEESPCDQECGGHQSLGKAWPAWQLQVDTSSRPPTLHNQAAQRCSRPGASRTCDLPDTARPHGGEWQVATPTLQDVMLRCPTGWNTQTAHAKARLHRHMDAVSPSCTSLKHGRP